MENSKQEIKFRRRQNPFTQTSNVLIDDDSLSVQARFLYVLIARWIDAPEYKIYKGTLRRKMKIKSEETFDKYWKELKKAGYLIQYKCRTEKGRWEYEYELLDIPEKPENTKVEDDNENNSTTPPKNQGVEKPPGGKLGGSNNTDLHDTDLPHTDKEISKDKNNKYDSVYNKILSCSELSKEESNNNSIEKDVKANDPKEKEIIIPVMPLEYKNEFDKVATKRFKKDRAFYGIDFNNADYYNIFADAVSRTQLQDDVEVITREQYAYFSRTLKNMLDVAICI